MRENKDELMEEAKFYGLPGLAELLSKNETEKSEEGASEVTLDDGLEELERNSYQTQKILSDAIETLNNGQVSLRKDVSLLEESKEAFLKMAQKLKDTHFSETINLNVGGHTFFTSLSTLQKDPNSMLAAMFSQRFKLNKQEDGSYFIDRDGTHFRHILNYLRSGSLPRELIQDISSELLEEADFYNLSSLTEKVLKSTTIQLKVGNDLYWTTMYILRKDPEFLAFLFGENGKAGKINGVYVIKKNIYQMKNILAFLENGLIQSNAFTTQMEMIQNAKTLRISSLVNYLMSLKQSKILNGNAYYADLLLKWLKECIDNPCPMLVYLMEYGSFNNERMYSGATLIIAESTKGCIFGGFSSCSWNNTRTYCVAEKCFLFSLVSLEWTEPVILKAKDITNVYSQPTYFQFMNKNHRCLLLNVNKGPASSSYNVYQDCFIYPDGVPRTTTFLAGEQSFELKRLEVFAVNPC